MNIFYIRVIRIKHFQVIVIMKLKLEDKLTISKSVLDRLVSGQCDYTCEAFLHAFKDLKYDVTSRSINEILNQNFHDLLVCARGVCINLGIDKDECENYEFQFNRMPWFIPLGVKYFHESMIRFKQYRISIMAEYVKELEGQIKHFLWFIIW